MSKRMLIVPLAWRDLIGGTRTAEVEGETAGAMLNSLACRYPVLKDRLFTNAELHPAVNLFIGDTEVRQLQGLATPVPPEVPVRLLAAISGG